MWQAQQPPVGVRRVVPVSIVTGDNANTVQQALANACRTLQPAGAGRGEAQPRGAGRWPRPRPPASSLRPVPATFAGGEWAHLLVALRVLHAHTLDSLGPSGSLFSRSLSWSGFFRGTPARLPPWYPRLLTQLHMHIQTRLASFFRPFLPGGLLGSLVRSPNPVLSPSLGSLAGSARLTDSVDMLSTRSNTHGARLLPREWGAQAGAARAHCPAVGERHHREVATVASAPGMAPASTGVDLRRDWRSIRCEQVAG